MSQNRVLKVIAILIVFSGFIPPALSHEYSADKAMTFFRAKNWNQLIPYLKAWTEAKPDDPMPWYYLGTSYGSKSHGIGMERPADAKVAFQKAVSMKPIWPQAWNALGFTDIELDDYPGAAVAFEHATQQAPSSASYWNSLGSTYAKLNRTAQATTAFKRAMKLGSPDAANNNRILHTPIVSAPVYNFGNGGRGDSLQQLHQRHYESYLRRENPVTGAPLQN